MTHTHTTGVREAIQTDTIIEDLRALDFGEVEDYHPEDEAGARRAERSMIAQLRTLEFGDGEAQRRPAWEEDRTEWEGQMDRLQIAVRVGDEYAAESALDAMGDLEMEWGADPATEAARDILRPWIGETA